MDMHVNPVAGDRFGVRRTRVLLLVLVFSAGVALALLILILPFLWEPPLLQRNVPFVGDLLTRGASLVGGFMLMISVFAILWIAASNLHGRRLIVGTDRVQMMEQGRVVGQILYAEIDTFEFRKLPAKNLLDPIFRPFFSSGVRGTAVRLKKQSSARWPKEVFYCNPDLQGFHFLIGWNCWRSARTINRAISQRYNEWRTVGKNADRTE